MTSTPTRRGMLYAGVAAVAAAAGVAGAWWRERNDSGVAATGGEKLGTGRFSAPQLDRRIGPWSHGAECARPTPPRCRSKVQCGGRVAEGDNTEP